MGFCRSPSRSLEHLPPDANELVNNLQYTEYLRRDIKQH